MTIAPDTKNWTWVLERPCLDCGFDASTFPGPDVASMVRANAAVWGELLAGEDVRTRPDPATWSTLEYACHVRDVFEIFDGRLTRMLAEDAPLFANWDQDATAVEKQYELSDPAEVAKDLTANAETLAARFSTVSGDQWQRTGNRSDGAEFTIETFARYLIHDPVHHVWDVTGG